MSYKKKMLDSTRTNSEDHP
uniref:Uncharacterized protein n=1 Tax=Rhizophora mucronata TaxID=61149 RepID=A0A2P2Q2S8_RHIMU